MWWSKPTYSTTLVRACAVLSWGSGDTKDLERDPSLGTGPAADRGSGAGHVPMGTHGRAVAAAAKEAPSAFSNLKPL